MAKDRPSRFIGDGARGISLELEREFEEFRRKKREEEAKKKAKEEAKKRG
ncbi:hypothetical protein H8D30_01580 [bacterium]|nr:hypothetical protein [bacterium]